MNLWIRSQDRKKLVNCNDIVIKTKSEDGETIRGYSIVGGYEELGFYTSLKSAEMVLDKIETRIAVLNAFEIFGCSNDSMAIIYKNNISNNDLNSAAYPFQMPLDRKD